MFKRLIASLVCLTFSFSNLQYVHAQDFSINQLPVPGTMVGESAPFAPLVLKGLVVNPQKPLEFQFIVDTGRGPQDTASIKEQANQLVKYFLAGLTIPEGDLWVNLSPYEKTRMVPAALGQTDLGRDLLAQDYILKQLTASLIYPEKDLGKEFWSRVYAKAQQQFGTTNVPLNTFNKVWILPDQAQVYENVNAAYVTKSTLKVMLDEDYLAKQKHQATQVSSISSQIVRQIILPEIEKEVNTGKNFAPLRQIYQALILAKWYKETIQNGLLDAVYTNKNKVAGVNLADPAVKEQIYERYLKAYKKGAFNYIKEDPTPDGQVMPRKFFSGGLIWKMNLDRSGNAAMISVARGALLALTISLSALTLSGPLYAQQNSQPIPTTNLNSSEFKQISDDDLIALVTKEYKTGGPNNGPSSLGNIRADIKELLERNSLKIKQFVEYDLSGGVEWSTGHAYGPINSSILLNRHTPFTLTAEPVWAIKDLFSTLSNDVLVKFVDYNNDNIHLAAMDLLEERTYSIDECLRLFHSASPNGSLAVLSGLETKSHSSNSLFIQAPSVEQVLNLMQSKDRFERYIGFLSFLKYDKKDPYTINLQTYKAIVKFFKKSIENDSENKMLKSNKVLLASENEIKNRIYLDTFEVIMKNPFRNEVFSLKEQENIAIVNRFFDYFSQRYSRNNEDLFRIFLSLKTPQITQRITSQNFYIYYHNFYDGRFLIALLHVVSNEDDPVIKNFVLNLAKNGIPEGVVVEDKIEYSKALIEALKRLEYDHTDIYKKFINGHPNGKDPAMQTPEQTPDAVMLAAAISNLMDAKEDVPKATMATIDKFVTDPEKKLPFLEMALKRASYDLRFWAIRGLEQILEQTGDERAVRALLAQLDIEEKDRSFILYNEISDALHRRGNSGGDSVFKFGLFGQPGERTAHKVRRDSAMLQTLAARLINRKIRRIDFKIQKIYGRYGSEAWSGKRKEQLKELINERKYKNYKMLVMLLGHRYSDVRQIAVEALGELGDKRAIEPLLGKLQDYSKDVISSAEEALVKLDAGEERMFNAYIEALSAEAISARANAAKKLGDLGKDLGKEDKERAIKALRERRKLEKKVPGYDVRYIEDALKKLGYTDPAMLQTPQIPDAAMFTVLRIKMMSDVSKLVSMSYDSDVDIRVAAINRLAKLATDWKRTGNVDKIATIAEEEHVSRDILHDALIWLIKNNSPNAQLSLKEYFIKHNKTLRYLFFYREVLNAALNAPLGSPAREAAQEYVKQETDRWNKTLQAFKADEPNDLVKNLIGDLVNGKFLQEVQRVEAQLNDGEKERLRNAVAQAIVADRDGWSDDFRENAVLREAAKLENTAGSNYLSVEVIDLLKIRDLIIRRMAEKPGQSSQGFLSKKQIKRVLAMVESGKDFDFKYVEPSMDPNFYLSAESAASSGPYKSGGYIIVEKNPAMLSTQGRQDKASLAKNGGIDLNQINVLRTGKTVTVQFDPAQLNELEQGGFEGFTPVITSITHISSPFQLLGINSAKEQVLAKV